MNTQSRTATASHDTFGTYRVSEHRLCDSVQITFFGSDADTARKGWRSIGVQSVPLAELDAAITAIERGGRKRRDRLGYL